MTPRRLIASDSSCPLRTGLALRFLKTLVKINRCNPPPSSPASSSETRSWRTQRIKLAAYSSMARAVGPRRAWSRALMLKLCAKRKNHRSLSARTSRRCLGMKQKAPRKVSRRTVTKKNRLEKESSSRVNELRRLVPGGESMDLGVLLEETAHFVQCLETQVGVMRRIADGFPC